MRNFTILIAILGKKMRFLLVNTNNAVRKIFNITAKKAAIQLDVVSAISQIPLKEDYNCIFIDDGVLGSGDVSNFRNKMMMTKFCIILSKDSPMIGGFDSYIRKPFLPTDIYEVMKKEKNSDLNTTPKSAQTTAFNANSDIDLNEFSDSEDEFLSGPKETIDFEMTPDLSINGAKNAESKIDLGLDSAPSGLDSALDSAKNEKSGEITESNQIADDFEINFTLDSAELSKESDSANNANAEMLDIKATQEVDLADYRADISLDSAPKKAPKSVDVLEEAEAQINNIKALADKGGNFYNSSNDAHSIDFSAVMALQDELLKEEETKKKKRLIGGDISKKKEPKAQNNADSATRTPKNIDSAHLAETNDLRNDLNEGEADFLETLNALNDADSAKLNDDLNFDALDSLQGISDIKSDEIPAPSAPKSANEILNNLDINNIEVAESSAMEDFGSTFASGINAEIDSISPNFNAKDFSDESSDETSQDAQKYNMLGLPINESGEIKDINDLSESELEKLDDEALLLLQERALQEKSKTPAQKSPKILNKAQIDTINNILETTQGTGENSAYENGVGEFGNDFGKNEFAIKNNEFNSITQEALSEALSEQNTSEFENDFGSNDFMHDSQNLGNFSDDFADSAINNFAQDVEPEESELPNFENFEQENRFAAQDFAQDLEPEEFELSDNFGASNLAQNPQNINEDFAFDLPAQPQPAPQTQQQTPQTPPPAPQIQNAQIKVGENLDLAEIIKTFPVDKLRDLLSGVQITINITFPNKKQ